MNRYNDMIYRSRPTKFNDVISNKYNIIHRKLYLDALNKYIKEWVEVKLDNDYVNSEQNKLDSGYYHDEDIIREIENNISEKKINVISKFTDKDYATFDQHQHGFIYDVHSVEEFKENAYIIELNSEEYWQPSMVSINTKYIHQTSPNLSWVVDLSNYWNMYQAKKYKNLINIKYGEMDNIIDPVITDINYVNGKVKVYSEDLDREFETDFEYIDGYDEETLQVSDDLLLKNTFVNMF